MVVHLNPTQATALTAKGLGFLVEVVRDQEAEIASLNQSLIVLQEDHVAQADMDAMWIFFCAVLVFFMQAGFAMLCAGCVRAKNTMNILLKNVLDACVGALGFWSVGYAFAYGEADGGNPFVGNEYFFLTNWDESQYHNWFFQFAFAATAATIVSGAVAERTKMSAYLGYSLFLTSWVYPVVVHWVWAGSGWLSAFGEEPLLGIGMVDFAGCGVVHMVGGLSGLIGAWAVGARLGRFDANNNPNDIPGHSATLQVLGTFILWVGWYGFNPGSTLGINGLSHVAAKTATTTTLSAVAGASTSLLLFKFQTKSFDLSMTLNGALAGLVSITASCSVVDPWAAVLIGAIGAGVYAGSSRLVLYMKVDDVVDAGPVHYFCGMWGLIASGLFCTKENFAQAYGEGEHYGLFYGGGGNLLGCQIIGILAITGWVTALMVPFFLLMKKFDWLRAGSQEELDGMDVSKHGGKAYPTEPEELCDAGTPATGDLSIKNGKPGPQV